jgi:integrase
MPDSIRSKTARGKLLVRTEPYWYRVRRGCHLGFRQLAEGHGTWIAKYRDPATGKRPQKPFGSIASEGKRDAFDIASKLAEQWFDDLQRGVAAKAGTVAEACTAYVDTLRDARRVTTADDAEGRFKRLVFGKPIGSIALDELKPAHMRKWIASQLPAEGSAERMRSAKDSVNRNRTALVAALNLARADGKVASDFAWTSAAPFKKTRGRRTLFLDQAERKRLLNAAQPDFRDLCEALLLTAARPGEIAAANVADLDRKRGTLTLGGKTGRRTVELGSAALELFTHCAHGRIGAAPLLQRADGCRWDRFTWRDCIREAAGRAKLPKGVVAYSLRHASISEWLGGGVDVLTVARLAGTSVQQINATYGHLVRGSVRAKLDAVRMLG